MRLRYEAPFDWPAMLAFFEARAVPGVEQVVDGGYRRTVCCDGNDAVLEVRHEPEARALVATLDGAPASGSNELAPRVRRMFDLDTDLAAIVAHLRRDPFLAPLVEARPALRVPAYWDPFETAMRAILGQQVSIGRARILNGRLVERAGRIIPALSCEQPHRLFPTPQEVLAADLSQMGMPGARSAALKAVAEAALADAGLFERRPTVEETVARLCAIKGVGPWTAQYIAIRACREPDAFPASDVGLLRGAADANGKRPSPAELMLRAEAWRPWRAYAAQHIWSRDAMKDTLA
jgi:AraC family transcriptional regulator of adaptative response / DNA-3-methyladenine glycosylase II